LIGRAAGLVTALLVAFSVIVLVAAGVMLGASAAAEIQRRREAIGVLRTFGATPSSVAAGYALESAAVAAPAACAGLLAGGALAGFGARLTLARPARAATLVVVLAASTAVVLLMLAIADVLHGLQRNAQTLGTRYQLTVPATETTLADVRAVRGVRAATVRYETDAADSFDLGESFKLVGFPGDVTSYESPPLASGRRVQAAGEAE